ncbi:hypothetical protein J437_LFUL014619 [Ladona fulva]|uniref:ARID domain-containing protein n=1 Tax=Ladona fulva TaxID=123851 RepID=A0A8K0KI43_LADFU|nr:hypothetical protein J437_LFUL014619 [Ladona fulva]
MLVAASEDNWYILMQACGIKRESMGDDPPYLAVGTEVSAKYKGAFCEAKVRKVVRSVKCKVTFKHGLGTAIVTDDQIRGTLRSGSSVEARHQDKKDFVEAIITKIQDCSQYTVVFDDGDITTLRRSALCLKSGRHFAESETLDQLPLTHPEHFSNPVIGGSRRGRRSRQAHEDGSDDEEDTSTRKGKKKEEKEVDIGKVVCVELGERKKQKDNWFPGLVVAPTAQDTVRIRVKDEYLVRSFKDGRYYTVPKKEATEFTREIGAKVDNNTLKTAVEKALQFLDRDELPPHWDRELLFGMDESSGNSDSDAGSDSDSSDDEPREEKDHFVAQLYKFMDDRGTPINKGPTIGMKDVDLYKLFKVVHKLGGYNRVTNHNQWKMVSQKLGFGQNNSSNTNLVKQAYKKFLHSFEDFYRKLGCTMVNHPRGSRSRHRSSRSLIRDRDRATPINTIKRKEAEDKEKDKTSASSSAKKSDKEETKVEEEKKKEETTKEEKVEKKEEPKKDEKKKADKKEEKKEEKKQEKKEAEEKKEEKDEKVEKVEKSKVKEEKKEEATPKAKETKKEPKSKAKEKEDKTEGKTRETSKGKPKDEQDKTKGKEKGDDKVKVKDEKDDKKGEEEPAKSKAKEESDKKSNLFEVDMYLGKTENLDKDSKASSSTQSSKASESIKAEPVEVASPSTANVESRKGREIGLRSQLKDVPSSEDVTKDVRLSEKDKSRGSEDVDVDDDSIKLRSYEDELMDEEDVEDDDGKDVQEDSKREERRRGEKKGDDDEKLTRSKSKESNPERKARESRTPVRESEKKPPSKSASGSSIVSSATKRPVSSSSSTSSGGSSGNLEDEKKRGRKRKELDEKGFKSEEHMGQLSNNIHVGIGDKLRVYYGPTHESKVTYEAKVIDTELDGHQTLYLVHYTGWNTRYDEWIKRSRIAENLSWTPTRAKRLRQNQSQTKPLGKRGRPSLSGGSSRISVDSGNGGPPGGQYHGGAQTRSTTPSGSSQSPSLRGSGDRIGGSLATTPTSSNSTSARGVTTRGNSGTSSGEFSPVSSFTHERRRSRRMSGHTDISVASESESEEYESEVEIEPLRTRSRKLSMSMASLKDEPATEEKTPKEMKSAEKFQRKRGKRKKEKSPVDLDADGNDVEDLLDSSDTLINAGGESREPTIDVEEPSSSEKKKAKRMTRRSLRDESEKRESLLAEVTSLESESEVPKGRDFDLNQIRSELKGIDKTVKIPIDHPPVQNEKDESMDQSEEKAVGSDTDSNELDVKESSIFMTETSNTISVEVTEDIYEFKEPEPFEFEVDERGMKIGRRCTGRLMRRDKPSTKSESKEGPSWGSESFKGTGKRGKKSEEFLSEEVGSKSPTTLDLKSGSDAESSSKKGMSAGSSTEHGSGKSHLPSSSEEDESPAITSKHSLLGEDEDNGSKLSSSRIVKYRMRSFGGIPSSSSMFSPRKSPSPSPPAGGSPPSMSSLDLCLFGDLPSSADGDGRDDDDAGDESEDRLIISDDPGEPEPLFTYTQRHEDLFPSSLITSSIGTSNDGDESGRKQSDEEPPCLIPMSVFELPKKSAEKESEHLSNIERPEMLKVVIQKEDDGMETEILVQKPPSSKCSVPFNDDMINRLLKDDDEGEGDGDESLNIAIQRAISSNITDEDDDDDALNLFSKKPSKEKDAMPTDKVEDTAKKALPKNAATEGSDAEVNSAKLVQDSSAPSKQPEQPVKVSPTLVESICILPQGNNSSTDTDSDSSEESRLVIDKLDEGGDDESIQSSDDEGDSEKKVKVEEASSEETITSESKPSEEKSSANDVISAKEIKEEPKEEPMETEKESEVEKTPCISAAEKGEEGAPKDKVVLKKEEEEVLEWKTESLLCEETIPGSPVPPTESQESCSEMPEKQTKVPEMPFASVPGSENCSSSNLLRSNDIRNEGNVCGAAPPNPQSKGSLEAYACESSTKMVPCAPAPRAEEAQPMEADAPCSAACKGKDSGGNDAAPVMDNTPPTTPESSLSTISGSPREERGGSSPGLDNESSKSHRESSEIDLDSPVEGNKVDHFSEDSLLNIEVSNSEDNNRLILLQDLKVSSPQKRSGVPDSEKDTSGIVAGSVAQDSPSKKRRRPHRRAEDTATQSNKRLRHGSARSRALGGSDSDDTSENSTSGGCASSSANADNMVSSRSPRPSKYNFYVELDPELDGTQRIALLQQKLQELRKTYMSVKAELACIDRRRKKLRRREREEKAAKHEVACS